MRIIIVLAALSFFFTGCEKDKDEYKTITGEWLVEDTGDLTNYRRYEVGIQRSPADTSLFIITNFYRTGINNELTVFVDGFDIEINTQQLGNYIIQGFGTIEPDYKHINLEYEVNGGDIGYETVISSMSRN